MRALAFALLTLPLASQSFDAAYFSATDPKVIIETAADKARTLNALDSRLQAEYARAYLAAGVLRKSDDSFASALQLDPKDSETRTLIARAWIMNGSRDRGLAALEPLRKPDLNFDSGYTTAAVLLLDYASPAEADAMMEIGFRKEQHDWNDLFEFAQACADHGQLDLAVKWYRRGAPEKDAPDEVYKRALTMLEEGHAQEASSLMEACDPKNKDTRDNYAPFGDMCYWAGEPALGAQWRQRGKARKDPENDPLREGSALLHDGHPEEAAQRFKAAVALRPNDGGVHRLIARIWFAYGFKEKALAALAPLRDGQVPDGDSDLRQAGLLLMRFGLSVEADAFMEKAWPVDKKAWEDFVHFGDACVRSGQASLALKWYTRGALKKEAKENLTKGAIDLLDGGHPEEAKAAMELAYQLDPRDWEDCCEFGRAAVRNRDLPLAGTYFARAVAMNAKEDRMWNEIALAYADKGLGIRNHFQLR